MDSDNACWTNTDRVNNTVIGELVGFERNGDKVTLSIEIPYDFAVGMEIGQKVSMNKNPVSDLSGSDFEQITRLTTTKCLYWSYGEDGRMEVCRNGEVIAVMEQDKWRGTWSGKIGENWIREEGPDLRIVSTTMIHMSQIIATEIKRKFGVDVVPLQ